MDEAEILAGFRDTYGDCVGWSEHHLAHCPDARVLRFEVTGQDIFESVLKCPHARPLGYSRLPKETS